MLVSFAVINGFRGSTARIGQSRIGVQNARASVGRKVRLIHVRRLAEMR
jgi:hypothetical protein